jgi:hypothetical protein
MTYKALVQSDGSNLNLNIASFLFAGVPVFLGNRRVSGGNNNYAYSDPSKQQEYLTI